MIPQQITPVSICSGVQQLSKVFAQSNDAAPIQLGLAADYCAKDIESWEWGWPYKYLHLQEILSLEVNMMTLQLTQKERMLLQDQLSHEEACIKKYGSYAQQAQDPRLQQLFTQHQQHEQQHHNTINQLLQGVVPNVAAGGQSQKPQQLQAQPMGVQVNQTDDFMCHDLLMTEKYVSGTYDTVIFESTSPALRQVLQHIQKEEQQHGEDLFSYMQQQGMYGVQ